MDLDRRIVSTLTEYEEHRLLENLRAGNALFRVEACFPFETFDRDLGELTERLKGIGEVVSTREALLARAEAQERQLLELSHVAQQYHALKTENERLRALLGSRARLPAAVLIAELIGVVPAPETHQIIIDKGAADGIEAGAPVIDAYGLFGQVIETARHASRVLLVTDTNHAVPVQINRNGVRSIAGGTGDPVYMELDNVPITAIGNFLWSKEQEPSLCPGVTRGLWFPRTP